MNATERNIEKLVSTLKRPTVAIPEVETPKFTSVIESPKLNGKFTKMRWVLKYNWNESLGEDRFTSKDAAEAAQEAYEVQHASQKMEWEMRTMDSMRREMALKMQDAYSDKVSRTSKSIAAITRADALKGISRMAKLHR